MRRRAGWVMFITVLAWGAWQLSRPTSPDPSPATLSAAGALASADTVGFARAQEPREFQFPEDHGPHPDFRTEWWYLTGNLQAEDGRRFGVQVTFFRNALSAELPVRTSAWNTNQVWMAHLALTDVEAGEHRYAERLARGAAGLAGATARPFHVWLEDWELLGPAEPDLFPMDVRAHGDGWGMELSLDAEKAPVLQGDRGLSRKGSEPGNASYYYSFTRLSAQGSVVWDDMRVPVVGQAWMDREWSTSALEEDHVGWDWFSLQLEDRYELMFFELRRRDGTRDPFNQGILVDPQGRTTLLTGDHVSLEVLDHWDSPVDGARYPSGWRLEVAELGIDLEIEPLVRNQEMNLSFRYWEGAVQVHGTGVTGPTEGFGYVELTGYAEDREDMGVRNP